MFCKNSFGSFCGNIKCMCPVNTCKSFHLMIVTKLYHANKAKITSYKQKLYLNFLKKKKRTNERSWFRYHLRFTYNLPPNPFTNKQPMKSHYKVTERNKKITSYFMDERSCGIQMNNFGFWLLQCLVTCGIYPTLGPGTPLPFSPGMPPSTQTVPLSSRRLPTMQESKVVLPQPDGPRRPYLQQEILVIKRKVFV